MASVWLCLECFEKFDGRMLSDRYRNGYYNSCPVMDCEGSIVEIDELIVDAIAKLNIKGYFTVYCCSGHMHQETIRGYISFESVVKLETIPEGWTRDKTGNTIRYHCEGLHTDIERLDCLTSHIKSLYEWIDGLIPMEWE